MRHGATDWNDSGRLMGRDPIELNARGRREAQDAARSLSHLAIAALYCSPQKRAQQTAALVAEPHGLAVSTAEALAEVWLGRWQGKTFAELQGDPDLEPHLTDPDYECDAIESTSAVQQRIVAFVDHLRHAPPGERAVLVSHGDPLRLLLANLLGRPLADYRRVHIGTGSVSVVRMTAHGAQLLALNWQGAGLRASLG